MRKEVIIFSLLNWESKLLHRSHMLAKYFHKNGYKVVYIQKENISDAHHINLKPRIHRDNGIIIINLPALPYFKGKISLAYRLNDIIMTKQLKGLFKLFDNPLIILESPYWIRAVNSSRNGKGIICYDISDDLSQFATNDKWKKKILEYEEEAIDKSDYIFITAEELRNKIKTDKRVFLIENGVDLEKFEESKDVLWEKFKRTRCGFIGGLFEWIDFDLIEKSAKAYPDFDFIFIGPTDRREKLDALCSISNIHYLGEKDKKDIGNYFAGLDLGLIPFLSEKEYPRLRTVNSNKVFQYCYFGYPVVSTEFQQVKHLRNIIEVYDNKEGFIKGIGLALQHDNERLRKERKDFALNNSWNQRVKDILAAVKFD